MTTRTPTGADSKTHRIRVLCVDDHAIVRDGVTLMIDREPDMETVASSGTGEEAVALFRQVRPDVTIMDLQLGPKGSMSGVDATRAICRFDPGARVIMLTMHCGDEDIYRALEAGATTYLLKEATFKDLTSTIRKVYAGKRPKMDPKVAESLARRSGRPPLTAREIQILDVVRQGFRNRQIAESLGISEETVQSHVKSILTKLDVPDRTAAVDVALRRGILHA